MLIGGPSFWFSEMGGLPAPRPSLPGPLDVDVAIVGGGFTGLWTAYYLKRADPGLRIALLESEICGYGASGRNGGWVSGDVPGYDDDRCRAAARETVAEVGRVCDAEGIDCGYHKGGNISVACNGPQLTDLRSRPLRDGASWLEPVDIARRVRIAAALGGIYHPHYARIQPARLARGLADVIERLGVAVYEKSPARKIDEHVVQTAHGNVRAEWVVRATEGYTASLEGLERRIVPARSTMIVTSVLPPSVWDELGWQNQELVHDHAHAYVYIQRTVDGRIAIGGRGRPYFFGSGHDRHGEVENWAINGLIRRLHMLFPATSEHPVEQAWSGVFGALRDWKMRVAADPTTGLASAGGYVGSGVAASNLAGRVLSDLIRNDRGEITELPFVNRPDPRDWEPEPIRFVGANLIYWMLRQADRNEDRFGKRSHLNDVVSTLGGWTHR